jgi:4-hydroxy-tetrahydrodipicolinate synthase
MSDLPPNLPKGVFAASLTPMNADLSPDHGKIVAHSQWLLANGCDGVAPLGTTGEANSLGVAERLEILDTFGKAGITGAQLIAGVGTTAIPDTVALTRKALEIGAGGVLMLPPFYYKGPSEDGLFRAYAETIERIADDRVRIYLYNFPQQVGFELPISLMKRLTEAFPGIVVGAKDSSGDWPRMERTLEEIPGFQLLPGSEEFLLAGLRKGGIGCISATTNVTAPDAAKVYANWQGPDADVLQAHLTRLRKAFDGTPAIAAMKALLALKTGDASWAHIRPPFLELSAGDIAGVMEKLEAEDFRLAA